MFPGLLVNLLLSQNHDGANSAQDSFKDQDLRASMFPSLLVNLFLSQNHDGANSAQDSCQDQNLHPVIFIHIITQES